MRKTENKEMVRSKRIWEIDFLRGVAILLMVLDHMVYDFSHFSMFFNDFYSVYRLENVMLRDFIIFCQNFYASDTRLILHQVFANLFFLLVGISCCFSKNNLKRGGLVLLCGLVLDAITYIAFYVGGIDARMIFNVLVIIGLCIIITWAMMKIKYHKYFLPIIGVGLIIIGIVFDFYTPGWVYELDSSNIGEVLLGTKAFGSDYFSVIPYIGSVFIGVFIGETVYKNRKSVLPCLDKAWNKPVCFVGRKTIWVYFLHQAVILVIIVSIGYALGYHVF